MGRKGSPEVKKEDAPDVIYRVYVDDSAESKAVIAEMKAAGLHFVELPSSTRYLPTVETGFGGVYEGLAEIRAYLIPDPEWPKRKAAIDRRFGLGSFA
jgi:hypothetical protein